MIVVKIWRRALEAFGFVTMICGIFSYGYSKGTQANPEIGKKISEIIQILTEDKA